MSDFADSEFRPRVLVVDDTAELRRVHARNLSRRGYLVDTACDGLEAHAKAASGEHDVIVTDIHMPALDGWGLLRRLQEDARTRDIPVALLTGQDDDAGLLRDHAAGASAYLSKWQTPQQVAAQVEALVEPLRLLARALAKRVAIELPRDRLAPLPLLRQLARRGVSAVVSAHDASGDFTLYVRDGELLHAAARAGRYEVTGEPALNAFLSSRAALLRIEPGVACYPRTLHGALADLLEAAISIQNANTDQRVAAQLLANAAPQVNADLYLLYARVAPARAARTAELVCAGGLTPREVLLALDESPLEVEDVCRDLVRRGVVQFGDHTATR